MTYPRDSRNSMSLSARYDLFLLGVGGQGVLTVGDLIAEAAMEQGRAVNFYPTKGMAQRGGSVKAQVRIGRDVVGPQIPKHSADLVIAMERSEALKGVPYVKSDGDFLLFGHVWKPTAVMLGKAAYPTLDQVHDRIRETGCRMHYLDPRDLPQHEGRPVPPNVFVLGAALGQTSLGNLLAPHTVAQIVKNRWKRYAAMNEAGFRAGFEASVRSQSF